MRIGQLSLSPHVTPPAFHGAIRFRRHHYTGLLLSCNAALSFKDVPMQSHLTSQWTLHDKDVSTRAYIWSRPMSLWFGTRRNPTSCPQRDHSMPLALLRRLSSRALPMIANRYCKAAPYYNEADIRHLAPRDPCSRAYSQHVTSAAQKTSKPSDPVGKNAQVVKEKKVDCRQRADDPVFYGMKETVGGE